jgi:hypothetical protein
MEFQSLIWQMQAAIKVVVGVLIAVVTIFGAGILVGHFLR